MPNSKDPRSAVPGSSETDRGERARLHRELTVANRTRDRFMAMMSHEMRTPLNAILGYAELLSLEVEGTLNEGQRRYLERIRVGSAHLLALINDVLDLSRADASALDLDIRPVNVMNVIEEVVALLEHQATQKGLRLVFEPPHEPIPLASIDLQRTRQILMNLLGNAIKFTDQGQVTIRVKSLDETGYIAIEVQDTGVGIAADVLPFVFDEFFQANSALTRSHGGSGLGLAISQRLAHAMGGEIQVSSEPNVGSTFTAIVPSAIEGSQARVTDTEQHTARMAIHASAAHRPGHTPVSVAAFGDDAASLERLAQQVRPAVRLVWTTAPSEMKALVEHEQVSLVILDLGSADGTAWRVAQTLTEVGVEPPPAILLLPSIQFKPVADTAGGVSLGWVSLIPKPFTAEQLTRAVSAAAYRSDPEPDSTYEVLVMDDDADSRRVARQFLSQQGIRVRETTDGEQGLTEMRIRPPDVVVLDLMMPVLDGFGVLAAMRADPLLSEIPVVVLTAKSLTEAERAFLSRTAERVLQKGQHRLADVAALVLRAAMQARQPRGEVLSEPASEQT